MSKSIDINELLRLVGADNKEEIEATLDSSSPSLVEYLLRQSVEYSKESFVKPSNIEKKLSVGNIDILFDYNEECHIIDNGSDPYGDLL